MSLSAAQYIYTNVEKKLSSTQRDGYQIWLRTRETLDAADEAELQLRLGDFEERKNGGEEPIARHLFFTLPSGHAVIARGVPLAETDKFSRGGRFYVHAVVLTPADFRQLGNDPFSVFDQVAFHASLEEGLKSGDPTQGTIPAVALENKPATRSAPELAPDKLATLLPVILRACGRDRPVILGVPGTPSLTLKLARELFAWLPPSLRLRCSFDTLSTGRSLSQVPYAVVGLPPAGPPRRVLNLLLFDAVKQSFVQPPPGAVADTFEQWLSREQSRGSTPPSTLRAEAVFQLAQCLDRGRVLPGELGDVDPDTFQEIACSDHGVPRLERIVRSRLETDVGPVLAPLLFALAFNALRSAGLEGLRGLGEPYEPEVLLRWMLTVYEHRPAAEIDRESEMLALKEALERAKNIKGPATAIRKKLMVIYCRWSNNWSRLAQWLRDSQLIPADIYEWFVPWALNTLSIRVTPGAGVSDGRVWIGPRIESVDPDQQGECERLVASLLGLDLAEDESPPLPMERWAWALETLKCGISPSEPGAVSE